MFSLRKSVSGILNKKLSLFLPSWLAWPIRKESSLHFHIIKTSLSFFIVIASFRSLWREIYSVSSVKYCFYYKILTSFKLYQEGPFLEKNFISLLTDFLSVECLSSQNVRKQWMILKKLFSISENINDMKII